MARAMALLQLQLQQLQRLMATVVLLLRLRSWHRSETHRQGQWREQATSLCLEKPKQAASTPARITQPTQSSCLPR